MTLGPPTVYILIKTREDATERIAKRLKQDGFIVHIVRGLRSPCDIIILCETNEKSIDYIRSQIHAIHDITQICILSAFSV